MSRTRKGGSATSVLSIRLTSEERRAVEQATKLAGSTTITQYVRASILSGRQHADDTQRLSPATRQRLLAQILTSLGTLDCIRNLTELANAARLGVLPVTPETIHELESACEAIHEIRFQLIRALGGRRRTDE